MNILKQWIFQTLIILLLIAPFSLGLAQTDEPEPVDVLTATPEATPEQTPGVIPTAALTPVETDDTTGMIDQIFKTVGLIVAGIVGGSLATIAGVIALIRTIRQDPEKMSLIEKLYDSRPDTERAHIRSGVNLAKELIEAADEATDGRPLRDKLEPLG